MKKISQIIVNYQIYQEIEKDDVLLYMLVEPHSTDSQTEEQSQHQNDTSFVSQQININGVVS